MTLSQFASGLSKAAVYVRHANAVKRGRIVERAVNYGWRGTYSTGHYGRCRSSRALIASATSRRTICDWIGVPSPWTMPSLMASRSTGAISVSVNFTQTV